MSWFSEIAGKAEGLLNTLDQSAATALQKQKSGSTSSRSLKPSITTSSDFIRTGDDQSFSAFASTSNLATKREARTSGYASSISSAPAKTQVYRQDEKLIDYLNEQQPHHEVKSSLSRRSSSSSLRSLPPTSIPSTMENISDSVGVIGAYDKAIDTITSSQSRYYQVAGGRPPLGTPPVSELLAREADFQKALSVKDGQLAVLRVRLQDADQQLQLKSQRLLKLEREQEKLFKQSIDHSTSRSETADDLERRLRETEIEVDRERNSAKKLENEFLARIQRLEQEQSDLLQQLTSGQKILTDEKIKCSEYGEQLKLAKYNLESNKLEFDEYKQKATRILQSKEKLIATLKNDNAGDNGTGTLDEHTNLLVQLEEMKTERDLLKEDLQQAHLQVYNLRAETQELESQMVKEQRSALEVQRHLQDQCQTFQQSSMQYREQYEQLKQDYQYVQDEMRRQHSLLQNKLREKDNEISKLMNQASQRFYRENIDSEQDLRLRQLTENLIHKQTLIEALQTDKQTLTLQLERMNKMYREAESAAIRGASVSTIVDIGNGDEGLHSRIPAFLRETPYDTGMARSVKKAYSTVEKFNVRFGLFLRRYPMARLFLFAYAILLHVWVMVVLLTYSPEIHSSEYKNVINNNNIRVKIP